MISLEEKLQQVNQLIPDKKMQDLIFGFANRYDDFLTDEQENIKYFYNTIVVGTLVIYRKFLTWKQKDFSEREEEVAKFSNSKIRLYNLLDGCYDIKKFDLDLIENLLINLHIDCSISPSDNFLTMIGLEGAFHFKDNITKYIFLLKKSRLTSRGKREFYFENLTDAFEMFHFLSQAKVEEYACDKTMEDLCNIGIKIADQVYKMDELICLSNESHCYYYLEDFGFNDCRKFSDDETKRQTITLNYLSFSEFGSLHITLKNSTRNGMVECKKEAKDSYSIVKESVIENFLLDYDIINVGQGNESGFFKDYISFNNRYIKYFSLAIADTISFSTKTAIIKKYRKKYSAIFDHFRIKSFADNFNANYYSWDEIIIFLLLEEGIFDFLVYLLKVRGEKYESFVASFTLRFGKKVETIKKANRLIEGPTVNLQVKSNDNIYRNEANALILLATKLLTVNDVNYDSTYITPSIFDIIEDINQKYHSEKLKPTQKLTSMVNILISTLSFLDIFYYGLLEYIQRVNIKELAFNETWFPTPGEYRSEKVHILKNFSEKVNERKTVHVAFSKINKLSANNSDYIKKAVETINEDFELLYRTNDLSQNRQQPINEALYNSLGKRSIFVAKTMKDYQRDLITMLAQCGNLKNDDSGLENFYTSLIHFLYYIGGIKQGTQRFAFSIFPIVCAYLNGVISRDGYRYSYMMSNGGNIGNVENKNVGITKIKMITNAGFDFGQMYYCLPNIKKIANIKAQNDVSDINAQNDVSDINAQNDGSESIWINPIIIPQNSYKISTTANFAKLSEPNDYPKAAELLYYTDEMIYGNLFGSKENAVKALPRLFEEPKSIFWKKNFYIAKLDDKVIGIVSLYKELPRWNPDIIEKVFYDEKIPITEKTKISYKYFSDTFNDTTGSSNIICDLCVDKDFRNKGVARFLIFNIMKKVEESGGDLLISVYSDNVSAINLYTAIGFIRYESDYDTRGTDSDKNEYYKMIKYL